MTTDVETLPQETPPPTRGYKWLATWGSVALIVGVAIAFAWPSRHGEFLHGDDYNLVLEQVFVNHPSWGHAWQLLTMVHGDLYQPLPMLSFQANHALAKPDATGRFVVDPFLFHLTNIALHALNAVLAWAVMRRICGCRRVTLLVGLLFACHPLAMETVAWITGRMILLATTFSLLMIWLVLGRREGRTGWSYGAILAWIGALLSKVLPTVPIAAAWCDIRTAKPRDRRWWLTFIILLELTAAATVFAVYTTREFGASASAGAEATTSAPVRMLLAGRYYLENYVRPTRLSAWSPPPHNVSLISTEVGIGIAEWALLAGAAWALRRRIPAAWTGFVLFVILLAPFLGATAARKFMTADRYMYLPMVGLHLTTASLFIGLIDALARRVGRTVANLTAAAAATALIAFFMVTGWGQARVWSTIVAQARHTKAIHPDDAEVHVQLVKALLQRGMPQEALAEVESGRTRWPQDKTWPALQGEALLEIGDAAGAIEPLMQAESIGQNLKRVRYKLGLALDKAGRADEARFRYLTILARDPHYLPAWTALARNFRAAGLLDFATRAYEQALAINVRHRRSLKELADVMMAEQDWARAAELLEANLKLDPSDDASELNLAIAYRYLGKPNEALNRFDQLLKKHPESLAIRLNQGGLLASMGKTAEAEAVYKELLKKSPNDRNALIALHELLQQQHRLEEIPHLWEWGRPVSEMETDYPGWLAFSYSIARYPTDTEARLYADRIRDGAPGRVLADWGVAYTYLSNGDLDDWASYVRPASFGSIPKLMRREQGRVVVVALADLPEAIRNSTSGVCALVAALAFKGDIETARGALEQLRAMPDSAKWAERAQAYLDAAERID